MIVISQLCNIITCTQAVAVSKGYTTHAMGQVLAQAQAQAAAIQQQQQLQQQQQQQQGGILSNLVKGLFRMLLMYYVFQYVGGFLKGAVTGGTSSTTSTPLGMQAVDRQGQEVVVNRDAYLPLWKPDAEFYLKVFLSNSDQIETEQLKASPVFELKKILFSWDEKYHKTANVSIGKEFVHEMTRNNGSLYAHIYFAKSGYSIHPSMKQYHPLMVTYKAHKVNLHRPKIKVKEGKSLLEENENLSNKTDIVEDLSIKQIEWVNYWRPILPIRIVNDFSAVKGGTLLPDIAAQYRVDAETGRYFPVIYMEYFWMLQNRMTPLNDTVDDLNLEISYYPVSMIRWTLQSQMEASWKQQQEWGTGTEGESEEFRRILLESNPYLLAVTFAVSLLHMAFDFLAFKNDVQFWREKKDMEGLSVRTIFLNCFCQVVVFLYLMDNDTSWMILMSSFIGLLIEFWKINQAADCTFEWRKKFGVQYPWINIKDKAAYVKSGTAEHDKEAMRYLSFALYPLIIGYSIYSLVYDKHKSWYSWVLASLTGSVYTFGFIMMCPQLYLNYKLKSVAHLPWRMMTYKALNTFIDDLFAFVIKMPWLHRLSCFRDDVIFLIYLYQRWIYRVDYTRANEFGYVPAEDPSLKKSESDSDESKEKEKDDSDNAEHEPSSHEQEHEAETEKSLEPENENPAPISTDGKLKKE